MLIQHEEVNHKGTFFVKDDNRQLAEMTYSISEPNIMIIKHTEVDEALRGKNVGYQLVQEAVEFARKNKYYIIPLCPFANAVFKKKKEEYKDVIR